MNMYTIELRGEGGEPLAGQLSFLNANGTGLGVFNIPSGGIDMPGSAIPEGTVLYHASAPGYRAYTTQDLYAETTFALTKETPVVKYVILGGVAVGAMVLLSRFIKI